MPRFFARLMGSACRQSADFHEPLDPFAPAVINVSRAGESASLNWFDTARELTERWHQQQQIRAATHRPGIMIPDFYHPVLDCFMRGLPHAFQHVEAAETTSVRVQICGDTWLLEKNGTQWGFVAGSSSVPSAIIKIPQEIAWRVFTKGMDPAQALAQSIIAGDRKLAEQVFRVTAIVA